MKIVNIKEVSSPKPIIRWAGSKKRLLTKLVGKVPHEFNTYIEPFAGSACLFFALQPDRAILADKNTDLVESYRTIIKHPNKVLKKAKAFPVCAKAYYSIRDGVNSRDSKIWKAARFLYLNRYCFNAIYRTNLAGKFNVPFGEKTGAFPLESDFLKSTNLLKRAEFICADFEETLSRAKAGDFVYLDPPYASDEKLSRNEYGNGSFSVADLPRLFRCLKSIHSRGVRFLLSYSYSPEILEMLPKTIKPALKVRRSIAADVKKRKMSLELLADNDDVFGLKT